MVSIYAPSAIGVRLEYIADHLFRRILGVDYKLFSKRETYLKQDGMCINYSDEDLPLGLHILPQGLLSERGIRLIDDLHEGQWQEAYCFFCSEQGDIPFDVFAAAFFLLTCYEEYTNKAVDRHGRFPHTESLLYRNHSLETPLVDRWAYLLKSRWEKEGIDTSRLMLRPYRFVGTFDIDHPYLYRKKGLLKNTYGLLRDWRNGRQDILKERLRVLCGKMTDPYFEGIQYLDYVAYVWADRTPYPLFVLMGKRGRNGRTNVYPIGDYYRYLQGRALAQVGLHGSYDSYLNETQLRKEKEKLERILGREITSSRQHYLRLRIPDTFRILEKIGIRDDYSLGFAHAPGFRSGTATPYPFFDVENDRITTLTLHPTVVMDTTLITHQGLSPEEGWALMTRLVDDCRSFGGDFVGLWHNSNLTQAPDQDAWRKLCLAVADYATRNE